VRKSCFTSRTLEFLKLHISPWPPPLSSSSAYPSAAQQDRRWPPCRATRGPPASPSLHVSPASLPTALAPSCWPSPSVPRRSVARPSRHLAVAVASTPAAYKTLSFLAEELPELTLVLFHHFISAERVTAPDPPSPPVLHLWRALLTVGSHHQPTPAQIDPRVSFLIAYRCSSNLPRRQSPTRSPYRRSPSRFFSAAVQLTTIRHSRRSLPSTSIPPEPHHLGAAHRPHPHPSLISSMPEHRCRSRAPSPPPRVIVVPPPPVDPNLHITPSKVCSSPPDPSWPVLPHHR
jgi:hypothetical protein